jgi:hypothetical protein
MKGTDKFKETIKAYLDGRAADCELFAAKYANEEKNIDDCITYILNTVKQSGANGFNDEEIYNMAIHYYEEENIDVGKDIKMDVVVNHHVELTDEEKTELKKKAEDNFMEEQYREMHAKTKKKEKKKEDVEPTMGSLF